MKHFPPIIILKEVLFIFNCSSSLKFLHNKSIKFCLTKVKSHGKLNIKPLYTYVKSLLSLFFFIKETSKIFFLIKQNL